MKKGSTQIDRQLFISRSRDELCLQLVDCQKTNPVISQYICNCADLKQLCHAVENYREVKNSGTLLLSRQDVSIRLIQLPEANPNESRELISLLAETEMGHPLEELFFDYFIHELPGSGHRYATFVSTQKSKLDETIALLGTAKVEVHSAIIPDLAVSADSNGVGLDITLGDQRSQIIISKNSQLISSLNFRSPATLEKLVSKTGASWRQLRSSLPTGIQELPVAKIRVCSEVDLSHHASILKQHLPDAQYEFIRNDQGKETFAVRNACRMTGNRSQQIDLLKRRNSDSRPQVRKKTAIQMAVTVLLISLSFFWWIWSENHDLDRQLGQLDQQEEELQQLIERGQQSLEAKQVLDEWNEYNVDWTSEIKQLSAYLPETERIYLTRLQLDVSPRSGKAIIRASGKAREYSDITQLNRRLVSEPRYLMQPVTIHPSPTDRIYKVDFDFEAELNEILNRQEIEG